MFVDCSCLKIGCHVKKKIILKLFSSLVVVYLVYSCYQQCSFLVITQSKCPLMKFIVSFQTGNVLKMTGHGEKFTF